MSVIVISVAIVVSVIVISVTIVIIPIIPVVDDTVAVITWIFTKEVFIYIAVKFFEGSVHDSCIFTRFFKIIFL